MSWVLQKQPSDVFYKKDVLTNFLIFTGKHLCWNLFLNNLTSMQLFKIDTYCYVNYTSIMQIYTNKYACLSIKKKKLLMVAKLASLTNVCGFTLQKSKILNINFI